MITDFYQWSRLLAWVTDPLLCAAPLFAVAVLFVLVRRPRVAAAAAVSAFVFAIAFSTPAIIAAVQASIEASAPRTFRPDHQYDAVVSLAEGGPRLDAAIDVVRRGGARRLVASAMLSDAAATTLRGRLLAAGLRGDQIAIEPRARNTHENAVYSTRILRKLGDHDVLLVTSAVHVPRALDCFRREGLEPDVLPVDFGAPHEPAARAWIPSRSTVPRARAVLHELIGRVVYRAVGFGE